MNRFFNMDNGIFSFLSVVADLIILNLIFIICCVPLVTIGASFSALYTVTLKMVKKEEGYIIKGFLTAFKNNFKQSTITFVLFVIAIAILLIDIRFLSVFLTGIIGTIVQALVFALLFILSIMASYTYPLIAKFTNTTKNILRNALLMAIRHLPFTILILLVNILPIVSFFFNAYTLVYGGAIYLLIGFSISAFVNSYLFNRIFEHYID